MCRDYRESQVNLPEFTGLDCLEEISFSASDAGVGESEVTIDRDYVDSQLGELASDEDLSRFIL